VLRQPSNPNFDPRHWRDGEIQMASEQGEH
jgi:hypothetical protein